MKKNVPNHLGFIVDGNRRWAKQKGLTSIEGHVRGYEKIKEISLFALDQGIKYVSAYVFSTENWKRDEREVGGLMKLAMRLLTTDIREIHEKNAKIVIAGSREGLGASLISAIDDAEKLTKDNTGGTLVVCFNYGGQQEIVDAVKTLAINGADIKNVAAEDIEANLYAPEVPPLDMVVRTSGEKRLSNFMLWRIAYSEIMFIDKMWPDMTKQDLSDIIVEYNKRTRRFGG